jgi:hypothetical protein
VGGTERGGGRPALEKGGAVGSGNGSRLYLISHACSIFHKQLNLCVYLPIYFFSWSAEIFGE